MPYVREPGMAAIWPTRRDTRMQRKAACSHHLGILGQALEEMGRFLGQAGLIPHSLATCYDDGDLDEQILKPGNGIDLAAIRIGAKRQVRGQASWLD
jgi:hypothetical protein